MWCTAGGVSPEHGHFGKGKLLGLGWCLIPMHLQKPKLCASVTPESGEGQVASILHLHSYRELGSFLVKVLGSSWSGGGRE